KTLKASAIRPPRGSITAQQRAFNNPPRVQRRTAAPVPARPFPQRSLPGLATPLSRAPPPARVPGALPGQAGDQRRHLPLQTPAAVHRQCPEATSHRPGGDQRRDLVHLLQSRAARTPRRTRLCHPGLTPYDPLSVTHVAGLLCYLCSRLLTEPQTVPFAWDAASSRLLLNAV